MPKYQTIADELAEMAQTDQELRYRAVKDKTVDYGQADKQHTVRLKQIVAEIGWPTPAKVGKPGAEAAWLLVQHARHDLEFMKYCLDLLRQTEGVDPSNAAMLEDRILLLQNKPQIYGSQMARVGDHLEPYPIADFEHVNQRRASVGLGTYEENIRRLQAEYQQLSK